MHKTKLALLDSVLVRSPQKGQSVAHRTWRWHQCGLFWESSGSTKDMTLIQDKKVFWSVWRTSFGAGQQGSEQYCPHLFQTVLLHPSVQQAIQPGLVWHDSLLSKLGLNYEMLILTKLPLPEGKRKKKKDFSFLLVSAFTFLPQQKQQF